VSKKRSQKAYVGSGKRKSNSGVTELKVEQTKKKKERGREYTAHGKAPVRQEWGIGRGLRNQWEEKKKRKTSKDKFQTEWGPREILEFH